VAAASADLRVLAGSAAAGLFACGAALRSAMTPLAFSTDLLASSLRAAGRLTVFLTFVGFGAGFLADIGHSSKAWAL
jgi:hypothetical protein